MEEELAKAHIEAKTAWEAGATEAEMQPVLAAIRKGQWRWDFAVASHGASFHAPQEITRMMSHGLDYALQARLALSKVLMNHGIANVAMPDISTKEKAQKYIGLDMADKEAKKQKFLDNIVPQWLKEAKEKERYVTL